MLIQQRVSAWQAIVRLTKNIKVCTQLYGGFYYQPLYNNSCYCYTFRLAIIRESPCTDVIIVVRVTCRWSMEQWWSDTDRVKTEVLGVRPVPLSVCPPQISHELAGIEPGPLRLAASDCITVRGGWYVDSFTFILPWQHAVCDVICCEGFAFDWTGRAYLLVRILCCYLREMNAQCGGHPVKANDVTYRNLAIRWGYVRVEVLTAVNMKIKCLLGCVAVWFGTWVPTFRRNLRSLSSG